MRLIDEIMRCTPVFAGVDEAALASIGAPQVRALLRSKNGTLALSGGLVVFGCGRDLGAPMNVARWKAWPARRDYGLQASDDIFAADVFGDLLFARDGVVFRLDGEMGDHVEVLAFESFLNAELKDIAEDLGGPLARQHFANRAIGDDPLRLLPSMPFMMKEHERGGFFETPLTRAIELKYRLFRACRDAPDGAGIDCAFWRP